MLKLLLDTNVVISGVLWHGTPHRLLLAARQGKVDLASCIELLDELNHALSYGKFSAYLRRIVSNPGQKVINYAACTRLCSLTYPIPRACRDPADDKVLACAVEGKVDFNPHHFRS